MRYSVVLRQDDEGNWLGSGPTLPGCHTWGGAPGDGPQHPPPPPEEEPPAPPPPPAVTASPTPSGLEQARVVRVVDGDTIDVLIGGEELRLRYIGIDTPEPLDPRRPAA